ncbi:MAG: polyprenyl synthetase family protein, partial [Nitrososphaera sp.]|nr:polyprenyl synthetase family protein [Nitrososphaera sp.]
GAALQIYDDVLDLFPQRGRTKPFAGDIKRRKKRLPLIHLLDNCSEYEKKEVKSILLKHSLSDRDARRLIELMIQRGSVNYALQRGKHFSALATYEARRACPPANRDLFAELVEWIQPDNLSMK